MNTAMRLTTAGNGGSCITLIGRSGELLLVLASTVTLGFESTGLMAMCYCLTALGALGPLTQ
jgi:hypothetical protein